MKRLLVLMCVVALCLAAVPAMAEVSYGVIGGLSLATLRGENVMGVKSRIGFSAGGFVELPLIDSLVLHPEALFSLKGTKAKSDNKNYDFYYLDVPVLAKYYLPLNLPVETHLFAGPYVSLLLLARHDGQDWGDYIKNLDYGLVFGGGAEVKRFLFDARYSLGLAKIGEETADNDVKNSVFSVMVGYRIK